MSTYRVTTVNEKGTGYQGFIVIADSIADALAKVASLCPDKVVEGIEKSNYEVIK